MDSHLIKIQIMWPRELGTRASNGYRRGGFSTASDARWSRIRGDGARNMEIYVATSRRLHLFYDLFLQGWGGGMAPSASPGSATAQLPRVAPDTHEW